MAHKAGELKAEATAVGQRGPVEHERREQILEAAGKYFLRFGYNKTTVADLAKAIRVSTAYIYKFFESKQAIGEAVCASAMGHIADELKRLSGKERSAADRLRSVYKNLAKLSVAQMFHERTLHDLAATACLEKWQATKDYETTLFEIVHEIIILGREAGEFEKKTPIEEVGRAVLQTMELFWVPMFLERNFDDLDGRAQCVANLVLRSLSP